MSQFRRTKLDENKLIKIEVSEEKYGVVTNETAAGVTYLFEWNLDQFGISMVPLLLLLAIFCVVSIKQSSLIRRLTNFVPEPSFMIITGIFLGAFFKIILVGDHKGPFVLEGCVLESVLIAPLILHASLKLFHRHFFRQIGSICIFTFLATVSNTAITSLILYYGYNSLVEEHLDLIPILAFASLISAVVRYYTYEI